MTLTKAGASAGALLALMGLFSAVVPADLYVATRGWVSERFGPNVERTKKMFVTDLRRSISHYNKQICYGTHADSDFEELTEAYLDYHSEVGEPHPFVSQGQGDICHKLRVPYQQ